MAVRAARIALDRAGTAAGPVSELFHSHLWFQGAELWMPAASYIAEHTVGYAVPAFGLQQSCDAGVAGLELAAGRRARRTPFC